ncbi:MAG: isoprenylcysteine carboxylmethyltransferase family protein [Candidatus Marinimicrobia bacterium]|nr:isoprenylcysteine carboxylmethyltransferase family protein [Candidatus Neomarinimicrobiota bacterium]
MANFDKGAGVKFPPPLVHVGWMIIGAVLQKFFPTDMGIPIDHQYWGLGMVMGGFLLLFYIHKIFQKAKTNIKPWKPTSNIITTGIYAYSRNPIYVAFNIFPIGLGIFFDNLWVLGSFLPAAFTIYYIAIKKEETYLETTFGEEYLDYKKKVRRWI